MSPAEGLFPPEHVLVSRCEVQGARLARVKKQIAGRRNLNPPRRNRSYPRVVKRARCNFYRVKKRTDVGVRHAGPPVVVLAGVTRDGTLINTS